MKIRTHLKTGGPLHEETGLVLADELDESTVPTAEYFPDVIGAWADLVEEIEQVGKLEVGIWPVEVTHENADQDSAFALVARVPDEDVAAFACPILNDDEEPDL